MTPAEASKRLAAFRRALPVAILRGLRRGLRNAQRLATTKYMERKDNRDGAVVWASDAKLGENAVKTGRVRGKVKVQYEARIVDPPNPPPGPLAIRQANLARTVRVTAMRWDGRAIEGGLAAGSNDVRYARIHELGGYAGRGLRSYIPARPYLGPALRDPEAKIERTVVDEIMRAARASLGGMVRAR